MNPPQRQKRKSRRAHPPGISSPSTPGEPWGYQRWLAPLLALLMLLPAGCVTDPQPDIPLDAVVTYETVRLQYAEEDNVTTGMFEDSRYGTVEAGLVGDQSDFKQLTESTILGTNLLLFATLFNINVLTSLPATNIDGNDRVWVWKGDQNGIRTRFTLDELGEGDEGTEYGYVLDRRFVTEGAESFRDVFTGEFENVDEVSSDPKVRTGQGVLRYHFDNQVVFEPDSTTGELDLSFRSRGGVRQVRVFLRAVQGAEWPEPLTGVYEYVELPDGGGTFQFSILTDFMKDGEPLEQVDISVVWLPEGQGRVLAVLTEGSLPVSEAILEECWDATGISSWIESTPDLGLNGGAETDCAPALQGITIESPEQSQPGMGDPPIPGPHPDEE